MHGCRRRAHLALLAESRAPIAGARLGVLGLRRRGALHLSRASVRVSVRVRVRVSVRAASELSVRVSARVSDRVRVAVRVAVRVRAGVGVRGQSEGYG